MYYGNFTTAWSSCFDLFLNYIHIFIIKVFLKKISNLIKSLPISFFFPISLTSHCGYVFSNCFQITKQFLKNVVKKTFFNIFF